MMKTHNLLVPETDKKSGLFKSHALAGKNIKSDFGSMVDALAAKDIRKDPAHGAVKAAATQVVPVKQANILQKEALVRTPAAPKQQLKNHDADPVQAALAVVQPVSLKKTALRTEQGRPTDVISGAAAKAAVKEDDKKEKSLKPVAVSVQTAAHGLASTGIVDAAVKKNPGAAAPGKATENTQAKPAEAGVKPQAVKEPGEIKIKEFKIELIQGRSNGSGTVQNSADQVQDKTTFKEAINSAQAETRKATLDGLKTELSTSAAAAAQKAVNTGDEYMVVIKLNPPSLGDVEVRAKYSEGRELNVTITANNDTALIAVKAASETLKNELSGMFAGQGTGVNVDVNQNSRRGNDAEIMGQTFFTDGADKATAINPTAGKTAAAGKKVYLA